MVTRGAHASIESVPSLRRLLSPDLTATDYVATLRHMRAFQGSLEPLLALRLNGASGADRLLDGNQLAALDADLAWFRAAPLLPPRLPAPGSAAAALGALYVLEGSNLGGRIIGKHVARTLGVRPGSCGSRLTRQALPSSPLRPRHWVPLAHSRRGCGKQERQTRQDLSSSAAARS
jgi:heme oxygenase